MPAERIRYRSTALQRVLPVLPVALVDALSHLWFWWNGGPAGAASGAVVLPLVVLIASHPFGVTLTPSGAVVHNLTRRTIAWADVQAIGTESVLGARFVVIQEAGGRHTRLRAPLTGFLSWDRAFDEKLATIGRWWLDHRGPHWAPAPPPPVWRSGPPSPSGDPFAPPR
ncbi:hypothetical protein ACIP98_03870 [Streptomyces sp. NPDC088354]|uniref:hypothetical protein n=1 Tax=Streptomyces sp. NPDC088354 TaxID=3365856 RepID=UPI003801A285